MRTDLKRHQSQRIERARLDNWHVLRGFDCRPSNVGAGATADVRRTASYSLANRVQEVESLQRLQQAKRIAATNEDRIRLLNCLMRIGYSVCRFDRVAHYGKARFCLRGISIAVEKCEWKKEDFSGSSEKAFDL